MAFLACGNLTIDDVVTADGALTAGQCGGTAVYSGLGMWLWREEVGILAGAGTDYPEPWLSRLSEAGLDLSNIWAIDVPHAMRSRVFYRSDGSRTDRAAEFTHAHQYDAELDLTQDHAAFGSELHTKIWPLYSPDVDRLPIGRQFDAVHVAPGPTASVVSVAESLAAGDRTPIVTVDWPWWDGKGGLLTDLLSSVTALLAGAEELRAFGPPDQEALLRDLISASAVLVVKQGGAGCTVFTEGRVARIPTFSVSVDDPTGAGDAFCGGFCVGMARTGDPVIAAAYGTVSASFVVESRGALAVLDADRRQARNRLTSVANNIVDSTSEVSIMKVSTV